MQSILQIINSFNPHNDSMMDTVTVPASQMATSHALGGRATKKQSRDQNRDSRRLALEPVPWVVTCAACGMPLTQIALLGPWRSQSVSAVPDSFPWHRLISGRPVISFPPLCPKNSFTRRSLLIFFSFPFRGSVILSSSECVLLLAGAKHQGSAHVLSHLPTCTWPSCVSFQPKLSSFGLKLWFEVWPKRLRTPIILGGEDCPKSRPSPEAAI